MSLLRPLFFLLIVANLLLVFFNMTRFDRAPGGEPDRLSSQLYPEKIKLVAADVAAAAAPRAVASAAVEDKPAAETPAPEPTASTPAPAVTLACVRWTGVTRAQADDVLAKARAAGFTANEEAASGASSWWVHIPPQTDRASAEKKAGELQRLGISDFFIVNDAGANQNAISLGLYKSSESAQRALEQLKTKGVQSARITERAASGMRIEVTGPADKLAGFSSDSSARLTGAARSNCAPQR
ncbi:SPOR domain-containing protein [Niveibacterium sp. SC-1]|uniref:SPOR domain-containing protein n=1 Tax=Niveibacterium sp. SC-1 TaxID=3135646 RepID=UPI00311F5E38